MTPLELADYLQHEIDTDGSHHMLLPMERAQEIAEALRENQRLTDVFLHDVQHTANLCRLVRPANPPQDDGELYECVKQLVEANEYMRDFIEQGDMLSKLRAAQERERELVAVLREVWESVPSSYDENNPMVNRHARALNAINTLLAARDAEPKGERDAAMHD